MNIKTLVILFALTFCSCGKSPLLMRTTSSQISTLETRTFFKTTSQLINLNWITDINTVEEGKVVIILTKNNAISDLSDYTLTPFIWMESMGHGSSPIIVTKLGDGIYELSEIYFTMPGDWQLHLQLKKNNALVEDVVINYNLGN